MWHSVTANVNVTESFNSGLSDSQPRGYMWPAGQRREPRNQLFDIFSLSFIF